MIQQGKEHNGSTRRGPCGLIQLSEATEHLTGGAAPARAPGRQRARFARAFFR
jgi:hypothetical protein